MSTCGVRVICRFRPVNQRELKEDQQKQQQLAASPKAGLPSEKNAADKPRLIFAEKDTVEVRWAGRAPLKFHFDKVCYDNSTTQMMVYTYTAADTVKDVLQGYNGTIFAYGQTGSGKTFTMFGPDKDLTSDMKGIIPRCCSDIFEHIERDIQGTEYTIKCSFLEIYKENVRDLLNPTSNSSLKVRETPSRGVWVEDLVEQFVASEEEVFELIKRGEKLRHVTATQMNPVSSRSHSLFTMQIQQKLPDGTVMMGKLNLADLAGSEKVGKTGASGETLQEAKKINQSLSSLGNCINALSKQAKGHVPYRDSKLTHVLRESLGGNSKTTLVIACSPHEFNIDETISTLRFGQRAKFIKNEVRVNSERSVNELNTIIKKLQREIAALRGYVVLLEKEVARLHGEGFNIQLFRKGAYKLAAMDGDLLETTTSTNDNATSTKQDEGSDQDDQHSVTDQDVEEVSNIADDDYLYDSNTELQHDNATVNGESSATDGNSQDKFIDSSVELLDPLAIVEAQIKYDKLKEASDLQRQDFQEEIHNLKEKITKQENELEDLRKAVKEKDDLILGLQRKDSQFNDIQSKLQFDIQQLSLENEKLRNGSEASNDDKSKELTNNRIAELEQKIKERDNENEKLKEMLQKSKSELEEEKQTTAKFWEEFADDYREVQAAKLEREKIIQTKVVKPVSGRSWRTMSMMLSNLVKKQPDNASTLDATQLDNRKEKQGYLTKQGGIIHSWKKRWCVVRGGFLHYFDDQQMKTAALGSIPLKECVVDSANDYTKKLNTFGIYHAKNSNRTYYFQASTPNECEEWIDYLNSYITVMSLPPEVVQNLSKASSSRDITTNQTSTVPQKQETETRSRNSSIDKQIANPSTSEETVNNG